MNIELMKDKRIILGVTGSIACYKAAELASRLTQAGALVDTVLTHSAEQFVTPLTFQSVTGRKAYTDDDLWGNQGHVLHIELGRSADLVMIAPATANTMAKLTHGMADNLLTVAILAATCPVLVAPAMDGGMFSNSATQANLDILKQRNVIIAGPAQGHLASGLVGVGRMLEPLELVGYARQVLGREGVLARRKIIVTSGGTREPIDPVRSITNRSSGKQGFALAQAAIDQGAHVVLISGPVSLDTPVGARRVDVESAEEMLAAVREEIENTDALIMAAAVADFRPENAAEEKIKKTGGVPEINLVAAPDILANVSIIRQESSWPKVSVGFAAESRNLLDNARAKLDSKKLDMIVANDISSQDAGFSVDTNRVTLLYPDGDPEELPLMSKYEAAALVVERVAGMLSLS